MLAWFDRDIVESLGTVSVKPCRFRQDCNADMASELVLIYWPEDDIAGDGCSDNRTKVNDQSSRNTMLPKRVITTNAITFRGKDCYPRSRISIYGNTTSSPYPIERSYLKPSVLSGSWEFTSPTIYLAHHPITVGSGDGAQWLDKTWEAGIILLQEDDVYSI